MEVGIVENLSSLERANMMLHMSKASLEGRLVLDDLQTNKSSLNEKLCQVQTLENKGIVDLGLYDTQNEDEGEIMLLAMILLQLHGVKLPVNSPTYESNSSKKKRQRTSPEQLAILEQIFQTDKMPNQQTRVQLADQLGMSSRRVQIWFQNKRAKVKRGTGKEGSQNGSPAGQSNGRRDSTSSSSSSAPSSPVPVSSPSSPASSPIPLVPQTHNQLPSPQVANASNGLKAQAKAQLNVPQSPTFASSQLQFSLASFESSQPLLLPNEYTAMRLQSMLKN